MQKLLTFLLALSVVAINGCRPSSNLESPENPEAYPFDFSLTSTENTTVSKSDFVGKVLVVDIWGTWCPPCREEVPHFVRLQEELGDQGLQMVGINYENASDADESISKIAEFTKNTPINYPLLIGTSEVQAQVPNFEGYPTTIFIDRAGNVRLTLVGARSERELRGIITRLLSEST